MKRDIICAACAIQQRDLFPRDEPYPGEYVKFLNGLALKVFTCDLCHATILKGEKCCAFSISTDRTPYFCWEHEFIKIKENP